MLNDPTQKIQELEELKSKIASLEQSLEEKKLELEQSIVEISIELPYLFKEPVSIDSLRILFERGSIESNAAHATKVLYDAVEREDLEMVNFLLLHQPNLDVA